MGRRVITGIEIASDGTDAKFLENHTSIDGKQNRLLSIPLGTGVLLRTTSRFVRSQSIYETQEEFKDNIKWIYGTRHENKDDWDYLSWKDPKAFPIEVSDQFIYDYADEPLVKVRSVDPRMLGKIYWLEAFLNAPEFPEAVVPKGIFIIFEDVPFIKNACFTKKAFCDFKKEDLESIPLTQYGSSVNLFMKTYKMADPSLGYHNYGVFKVTIFSERTQSAISDTIVYEQKSKASPNTFLDTVRLNILINLEWRDRLGHEPDTEESCYVEIEPFLAFNEKSIQIPEVPDTIEDEEQIRVLDSNELKKILEAQQNSETKSRIRANNGDLVLLTYKQKKFQDTIFAGAAEQDLAMASLYRHKELEKYRTKHQFKVVYNTDEDVIIARNEKVGQQMAAIKDTEYTCAPVELPCSFTAIKVNDPDREEILTVFEETDTGNVEDNTKLPICIIAKGQKKKNVVIELANLRHAGTPSECLSIGRAHENEKDVFGMTDDIVRSQMLDETDVKISGQKLTLSIKYNYNRSFNTQVQEWLQERGPIGKWANEKINELWLLRYFVLTEEQAQQYYIPISTCRFPSQTLKLKAYPKINWGISFSIGLKDPKYKEDWRSGLTGEKKKLLTTEKKAFSTALRRASSLSHEESEEEKKEEAKKKLNLTLSFKASYDKTEVDFTPGFSQKINDFIYALATAKGFIDEITGNSISKSEQDSLYKERVNKLAKKHGGKWLNKLTKLPVTITVDNPQMAIGVAWGRAALSTEKDFGAPLAYDIFVKASPLFGISGSLDLITCATFIPVAGQIIKVADIVLNVVGVEPVFKLTASGKVSVSGTGTIHYDENQNNGALDVHVDADIKLRIEASITVSGGLVGFIFAGGDVEALVADNSYTTYAETGFEVDFGLGVNFGRGPYVEPSVSFSGLVAVAERRTEKKDIGTTTTKPLKYTIVKPIPSLIGGIYFFNE